jgi:hypothetical protein
MSETRWVQHVSGQGEKWEALPRQCSKGIDWHVKSKDGSDFHFLPKSEYILCEPPVVWEDVTAECQVQDYVISGMTFWSIIHNAKTGVFLNVLAKENGYRVSKGRYGNFIIEQRKP